MRSIIFLAILILLSKILPCQAMRVITPYSPDSDTAASFCLPVFLDGAPMPLKICITNQEKNILILVYDHDAIVAGLIRPKVGVYSFYKAHLRDDNHEELIGVSVYGPRKKLTDIFILGFDATEGDIAPLPLLNQYSRPCYVSQNLMMNCGTLFIPLERRHDLEIAIRWNRLQQIFIASDYRGLCNGSHKD